MSGLRNEKGGRMGDATSNVSEALKRLGFEVERFKTGTPCRLNGRSIDFSRCERQDGDTPVPKFSFMADTLQKGDGRPLHPESLGRSDVPRGTNALLDHLHESRTPTRSSAANLHQSPMYCGVIEGVGPRYCPSIEDKVVRFAEKERHQVFLEPEGRHTLEYYVNGVSTSLPYEVQFDFLRSIAGLGEMRDPPPRLRGGV